MNHLCFAISLVDYKGSRYFEILWRNQMTQMCTKLKRVRSTACQTERFIQIMCQALVNRKCVDLQHDDTKFHISLSIKKNYWKWLGCVVTSTK